MNDNEVDLKKELSEIMKELKMLNKIKSELMCKAKDIVDKLNAGNFL